MHGAGTTGSAGYPGLPCAMVLRLIRDLPGDRAFLPPSLRGSLRASLAPASGRQDHTTSPSAAACARLAPASTSIAARNSAYRDDAYAPLHEAGYMREDTVLGKRKAEYFSREIWTTQISLNRLDKFAFSRTHSRADFRTSCVATRATSC